MYTIRKANLNDAGQILQLTLDAFKVYKDALHSDTPVKALSETLDIVKNDITENFVYVAIEKGKLLGSIRYTMLSDKLAYIYRFGVNPDINNTGIGSDLIKLIIDECRANGVSAIALHTNSKYYKLARYYYGKEFYVHSTNTDKGYIRALFIKELTDTLCDLSPAFEK